MREPLQYVQGKGQFFCRGREEEPGHWEEVVVCEIRSDGLCRILFASGEHSEVHFSSIQKFIPSNYPSIPKP